MLTRFNVLEIELKTALHNSIQSEIEIVRNLEWAILDSAWF